MLMRIVLQKLCCDPAGDGPKPISWNAPSQENTGGAFKCTWVFLAYLTSIWKFLKSFQKIGGLVLNPLNQNLKRIVLFLEICEVNDAFRKNIWGVVHFSLFNIRRGSVSPTAEKSYLQQIYTFSVGKSFALPCRLQLF